MHIDENIEENKLNWYGYINFTISDTHFYPYQNILITFLLQAFIELLETGILPLFFYWNVFQSFWSFTCQINGFSFLFFLIYMQYFMLKIMFLFLGFMDIIHSQFFGSKFSIPFHFLRPTTGGNLGLKKILWLRTRIIWLAHSSCFSFSYSPNHFHRASLVA